MVVCVDHKFHRKLCQPVNLRQQLPGRLLIPERVDDRHAVFADHESGVRSVRLPGLMVIDRGPRIRSDRLQRKRPLRDRLCAMAFRRGKNKADQKQKQDSLGYRSHMC